MTQITAPNNSTENVVPAALVPRASLWEWLLFLPFLLTFCGTLLVFDIIQRVAILFGKKSHLRSVLWLNRGLLAALRITGVQIKTQQDFPLSPGQPYIVVANHQSLFDIPILHCLFAEHAPRFIAKQELGRWIPSVSFNLRHGGNALIDRSHARQAVAELKIFGEHLRDEKFLAVIFPEGTRSRTGILKEFRTLGLRQLMEACPEAAVVPVALRNTWKLSARKMGPIPRGVVVDVSVLTPLRCEDGNDSANICRRAQNLIQAELDRLEKLQES